MRRVSPLTFTVSLETEVHFDKMVFFSTGENVDRLRGSGLSTGKEPFLDLVSTATKEVTRSDLI